MRAISWLYGAKKRSGVIRTGVVFQARVPVQAVDLGCESPRIQEFLHVKRGVADGVTAVEGREQLVDPHACPTRSMCSTKMRTMLSLLYRFSAVR